MTKPKRPPTNAEFNSAVLDKVLAQAMPADQRDDEFTPADLAARGMSESSARRFCMAEWKRGALIRRIGLARSTRRKCWIFKAKER